MNFKRRLYRLHTRCEDEIDIVRDDLAGLGRRPNEHDRQTESARIRFRAERTADPPQLVGPRLRQFDPDFEVADISRYGAVRNTLAVEVEAQIGCGQLADGRAFDADRPAARMYPK